MTKSSKAKLEYMTKYESTPAQIKKREENNLARQRAIREGKARVGDGTDVAHKVALSNGGSNNPGNTEVQSRAENRGWRKGRSGYKVPNVK